LTDKPQDCSGELARVFLGDVVTALDAQVLHELGEAPSVFVYRPRAAQGVVERIEDHCGHADRWLSGDAILGVLVSRVTFDDAIAVPIGVHDDVHEVRVIKGSAASTEFIFGELPAG
jgi:hypothetical protein